MRQAYTEIDSPVGRLLLAGEAGCLRSLLFGDGPKAATPQSDWYADVSPFRSVIEQLNAYFAGELKTFSVALAPEGTLFQLRVWKELERIPYGEIISYGQLAQRIGNPNASRAVGLANGSNPISIIVPCHRVIGANGKLTGYGGGLPIKEKLLGLERRQLTLI
jgi:methylated-DNA-[protein]-cysteine S-methyltransferase